jgi:hypothetical protein
MRYRNHSLKDEGNGVFAYVSQFFVGSLLSPEGDFHRLRTVIRSLALAEPSFCAYSVAEATTVHK